MRAIKCDCCGNFELGDGVEIEIDGVTYFACKKCLNAIQEVINERRTINDTTQNAETD